MSTSGKCFICDNYSNLDSHHVIWGANPNIPAINASWKHSISIPICRECHTLIHAVSNKYEFVILRHENTVENMLDVIESIEEMILLSYALSMKEPHLCGKDYFYVSEKVMDETIEFAKSLPREYSQAFGIHNRRTQLHEESYEYIYKYIKSMQRCGGIISISVVYTLLYKKLCDKYTPKTEKELMKILDAIQETFESLIRFEILIKSNFEVEETRETSPFYISEEDRQNGIILTFRPNYSCVYEYSQTNCYTLGPSVKRSKPKRVFKNRYSWRTHWHKNA